MSDVIALSIFYLKLFFQPCVPENYENYGKRSKFSQHFIVDMKTHFQHIQPTIRPNMSGELNFAQLKLIYGSFYF